MINEIKYGINEIKNRKPNTPLICLMNGLEMLKNCDKIFLFNQQILQNVSFKDLDNFMSSENL